MCNVRFIRILSVMFLIGMLCVSCATTHQTRSAATSGFLNDYSQLKEGTDEQALMVYIDENVNFNQYDKIIIKHVKLIASEDSEMAEIPKEDLDAIADYFYVSLNQKLSKKYTIAKEQGPKTMELKVALTDMSGSNVVIDTLGSLLPIGMAINAISKVATGNNRAVGSATGEMELTDSMSGKRLVAAVDGRSGTKYTGQFDKFKEWKDAKDACDYWAERIVTRLDELADVGYMLKRNEK